MFRYVQYHVKGTYLKNICLLRKNKNERPSKGIGTLGITFPREGERSIQDRQRSRLRPDIQCFWPATRKCESKKQKRDPPRKISYLPPNTLQKWITNNPIALAVMPPLSLHAPYARILNSVMPPFSHALLRTDKPTNRQTHKHTPHFLPLIILISCHGRVPWPIFAW